MRKKTIVIITSGQPSINPRLVKEADSLSETFNVIVLYQYWNKWATEADKILLKTKRWQAIRVGGDPDNEKLTYIFSRAVHRIFRFLRDNVSLKCFIAELAIARASYQLLKKALEFNADLYIGHNPGAIAVAALAARKRKVKCGFDAEDFHRNEYSDAPNHPDVRTKKYLEEKYFPLYDYITTASPLISREYVKYFPNLNFTTILNVFKKIERPRDTSDTKNEGLKLFWFSQTIGHNRGLEDIVHAIHLCNTDLIELHVLGNPREHVINRLLDLALLYKLGKNQITFYNPVPPDEIFELAIQFDAGMATEIGEPYNRDICLTNKIFTYLQSGLAIIASDTSAQINFFNENKHSGLIFIKNNINSLTEQIKKLFDDRALLHAMKKTNLELGQFTLNWETESIKLVQIVENVLQQNSAEI